MVYIWLGLAIIALIEGGILIVTFSDLVAALKAVVEKLIAAIQGQAAKDQLIVALQAQHAADTQSIEDLTTQLTAATASDAADQATIEQQKADLEAAATDRTAREAKIAELEAQVPSAEDTAALQTTLQEAQDALAAQPTP